MNLPQLAVLLKDVKLIDVRFGNLVLQRINGQLDHRYYFPDDVDGYVILDLFDGLPNSIRNNLRNITVVSPEEIEKIKEDVCVMSELLKERDNRKDNPISTFIMFITFVITAVAIFDVLYFIFQLRTGGELMTGVIYDAVAGMFTWMFSK